jgi:AcrR family transcriptional regulator
MSTLLPSGLPDTGPALGVPTPPAAQAPRLGAAERSSAADAPGAPPRAAGAEPSAGRLGGPATGATVPGPRERLLDVVVDAAVDGRLDRISIAELCHEADVHERRAFYRAFASKQDAFLHACLRIDAEFRARMKHAYATTFGLAPRERARACVLALVAFVEEDLPRAEAWIVHGHGAGSDFAIAREQTTRWLVGLGLQLAPQPSGAATSRAVAVEMAIGGVHELVLSRVAAGRGRELAHDVDLLVDLLMHPYGGRAASRGQTWPAADPRDPRGGDAAD